MMNSFSRQQGYLLIQMLIFGAVAVLVISGLMSYTSSTLQLGRRTVLREQAFQIAEAGLEYYRWHLAHAPADFTDGTGQPGPYVRNFTNASGTVIGTFSLNITPPELGSTLLTIESTGQVSTDPTISRTIVARLSIPSFANYAAVADSIMRFGTGTEVFGPLHSNSGLRFDGIAHNLVTSSLANYDDPVHSGGNEFGVHTHVNAPPGSGINDAYRPLEAPPSAVQSRSDVFLAGRSFPAPVVNFSVITDDLATMETDANNDGFYRGASGDDGYLVILRPDDTFDLRLVTQIQTFPSGCSDSDGSWSVGTSTLIGNYAYPNNGLIFLEDHVWVEGAVDGARLTIVAAQVPDPGAGNRKSLTFNNNLLYTNYDGTDAVALIAQNNVNAGYYSLDNLRIDAALVAQHGRVGRFSYSDNDCVPHKNRTSITLYGTIVTAQQYGFRYSGSSYNCGVGIGTMDNGYCERNIIYDAHLLYEPPPHFPQTDPFYDVIYWKED